LIFWDRLAFIRFHRGFTHSLAAWLLFALAGALAGRFLAGPRWFKPLLLIGLAVLGSHLLLDLATSYGTQLLSPFSRQRFSLDWIFIIDPYFTAVLVAGAISALMVPRWGSRLGAGCLAMAGVYLLTCALFHHQALSLARRVFQPGLRTVAALPQPFSCRRWHLIAAGPEEIQQTFVQLPFKAVLGMGTIGEPPKMVAVARSQVCPAPARPYQSPGRLTIQTWTPVAPPGTNYPPEVRKILASFLEFSRFPLLCRAQDQQGEQVLEWRDLRFSVPGRSWPFVLQVRLDANGRLQHWLIGRRG
jgi:inner membrane protein